jgi:hypothetical protein
MKRIVGMSLFVIAASFGVFLGLASLLVNPGYAAPSQNSEAPKFEIAPAWPKPLPEMSVTGEVGGTCADAQRERMP